MTDPLRDLAVIGAGIVGLATAAAVLRRFPGLRLTVLEKEPGVGAHQSGHNSGVIHSGVFYRPGSQKARLCVEGARAMTRFCEERGIPLRRCGKIVVATQELELPRLEEIHRRGMANGVAGLSLLSEQDIRTVEPACRGLRALHVPSVAVTDFGAVTAALAAIVTGRAGEVRTGGRVTAIRLGGGGLILTTAAGEVEARFAVNCAGLHSDRIARLAGADPGVAIVPFRGEYFEIGIARSRAVNGLIYPVPDPELPFLGAHLTKRLDGGVLAGPGAVLALKREGYRFTDINLRDVKDLVRFEGFWNMARRNWRTGASELWRSFSRRAMAGELSRLLPGLREGDLRPAGSGVRAQAVDATGRLLDDFHIVTAGRMVHVLNVPSPAATASLAIGELIAGTLAETFDLQGAA
jgi:L-2-hydroxyglutarate oxidase LhgO